jgi:DedD protein
MDRALKQRLVGASVLIVLTVIVLPMLLSGRSETLKQESPQIDIPPQPGDLSIETRRFPVGLPNKPAPLETLDEGSRTGVAQEQEPIDERSGNPAQELTLSSEDVNDTGAESGEDSTPVPVAEAGGTALEGPGQVTRITLQSGRNSGLDPEEEAQSDPGAPRYLVQVASFSSDKNANLLAERLRQENLPVMMDVVDRTAGRLHRVRVGPYKERSEADNVVSMLKSGMKDLDPRVQDLRPSESAPVSTPDDPLVRWVVQVGVFENDAAAEALVAELRLAGYTAFREKVTTASGSAFKVRIGPELEREKALELERKIEAERNIEAFVTTQD